MAQTKMSAEEMARYYTRVHREVLERATNDPLSAVIAPDKSGWLNRFTDFAHRLGMKKAFRMLEDRWGSLENRTVLDLGCGRGRWSKEYAARGAAVTGADISPEAIRVLSEEMPQHRFIAQDVAELSLPDESFDVVNSVTVLQHMPHLKQQMALNHGARWLKCGGCLVLFENILAFDAPHVFPHSTSEWIAMTEATGLKCTHCSGANFEVLLRMYGFVAQFLRGGRLSGETAVPSTSLPGAPSLKHRLKSGAGAALAMASFPVERLCQALPLAKPTHSVMIFSKQPS